MQISDPASNLFLLDDRMFRGDEGGDGYSDEVAAAHQEWANELQLERQDIALQAMWRCAKVGADMADLDALSVELGLSKEWAAFIDKKRQESAKHF